MTLSALQKFFFPPIVSAAAVFSAMSFPLATLGDKQVVIKFQEEAIYDGKLRDAATPYIVLATAMSIGVGISAAAVCGWRHSARKSAEFRQELSGLEKHLQEKEAILNELKLSESQLQISGLTTFLDDEVPFEQTVNPKSLSAVVTQPVVVQTSASYQQPINTIPRIATKHTPSTARTVTAASAFASAQTFLGYTQTNTNTTKEIPTVIAEVNKSTVTSSEFEELQKQLRQMMLQMQTMQSNLGIMPQATNAQVKAPDKFRIYYDAPDTEQVQFL